MANYTHRQKSSLAYRLRQLVTLFAIIFLVACSSNPLEDLNPFNSQTLGELNPFKEGWEDAESNNIGFVKGFSGGVVVDEPRASIVGRDILSSGGNAADAAIAVMLTLAVTQPSSASLGGGGACIIYDNKTNSSRTLDFLPGLPKRKQPGANSSSAVPGTLRGLAMLHSRYGRLKWGQLVSPAEKLARFGNPVSRAFAGDLRRLPLTAWKNSEFRRIFGQGKGGELIQEGSSFRQLDLSAVLGQIRVSGAGEFYTGQLGRNFAAAVGQAGGGFSLNDLRSYMPKWRSTFQVPFIKNTTFHFPITSGPSGVLAAQMIGMLIEYDDWDELSPLDQSHFMAEISSRANSYSAQWLRGDGGSLVSSSGLVSRGMAKKLVSSFQASRHTLRALGKKTLLPPPPSPGTGTSFVVVDREGSAISCGLTLNNLFGTGRVAPGTGVLLSALPGPKGRGPNSLAGALLINSLSNEFFFAAAASGGPVSSSALVQVAAGTLMKGNKGNLKKAIAIRRIHNGGKNDLTYFEKGLAAAVVEGLTDRGHQLSSELSLGLVNAVICYNGLPKKDGALCFQSSDPRGFGLSSAVK